VAGVFERRQEMGGVRYSLDDVDVHAGDVLAVQLADGAWRRARFEWAFSATRVDEVGPTPYFITQDGALGRDLVIQLADVACARWPDTGAR
jgi:hypothetical protein